MMLSGLSESLWSIDAKAFPEFGQEFMKAPDLTILDRISWYM